MRPRGFDLRYLVLKNDMETVLSTDSNIELLNQNERKIISEYLGEGDNILTYVRELLLNPDFIEESKELLFVLQREIYNKNSDNQYLLEQFEAKKQFYLSCIENGTGNNNCLFLPKSRILK